MSNWSKNELSLVIAKLRQVLIFSDIKEESDLEKIAQIMIKKTVPANYNLIDEGRSGDDVFILLKGSVRIVKKTLQEEKYTVLTLDETHNTIFGELALLDSDKRSATVTTETPCEFLLLHREDFIKFGDLYPHLGLHITRQIAKILAGRLRKANKDVITLFSALVSEVSGGES